MALDNERSQVAHLLRRAGFGYTEAELDEYTALGFSASLDRLLDYEQVDDSEVEQRFPMPAIDPTSPEARTGFDQPRIWWLQRMLVTRRPLQEKMTLFWHNHFATSIAKVRNAPLMLRQNQLFRENAVGSFETLLQRVTRDPAMLIWLDNRQNRKGTPNENYAREVQELFTLGLGNYTEDDVKAVARAFTGYGLDANLNFTFHPRLHDDGPKTYLGETKNWDADDILATLVRHPATARTITTKLFRYFVYEAPDTSTVDRLAATFTESQFDIRSVLRDLFTGPEFLSDRAYHALVKQPVDLVIGSLKAVRLSYVGPETLPLLRRMGQDLFTPPDVSGWKGGAAWISTSSLLERFNFANRLTSARDPGQAYFSDIPSQVTRLNPSDAQALVNFYTTLLVDGDLTPEAGEALRTFVDRGDGLQLDPRAVDQRVRGLVHLAMSLPTYQLS